jgi:phage shock protein E
MKLLTLLLAFVMSLTACSREEAKTDDRPQTIAAWIKAQPDAQILDVRTKEEFASGHLEKAKLIPWTDKDFSERVKKELDPAKPLLVYCRSGRRSADASAQLAKLGFKNLRGLDGGIIAWTKDGLPLAKQAPPQGNLDLTR